MLGAITGDVIGSVYEFVDSKPQKQPKFSCFLLIKNWNSASPGVSESESYNPAQVKACK